MLIAVGSDDRYALPLAITVHSALRNVSADRDVRLLIIDSGITEQNRERILRVVARARPGTDVNWAHPSVERFTDMKTTSWGASASYLPLLLPELLPDEPTVLYLDSDLLVVEDIAKLWDIGQDGRETSLYGVVDYGFPDLGRALKGGEQLEIDLSSPYFNSGVMLIDLIAWRRLRVAERALAFAQEHPELMRFTDQDALNVAVEGRWTEVDPRWNVLVGSIDRFAEQQDTEVKRRELKNALTRSPFIMHFSGPQKPWKPGYRRFGRSVYAREVELSHWFETSIAYRSWRLRVLLGTPFVRGFKWVKGRLWAMKMRLNTGGER